MKLSNKQIEIAFVALKSFKPDCSFKTQLRLIRNARRLKEKCEEKENDRQALLLTVAKDKEKANNAPLTISETLAFQPLYKQLMDEIVDVDLQPIKLVSIAEEADFEIALSKVPAEVAEALLDIVLVET